MSKANLIKGCVFSLVAAGTFSFTSIASAAAPTGTCGLIASMPHPEFDYMANQTVTKNIDLLAEINFTTNTINFSLTQFVYAGSATPTKQTVGGTASFTLTGPGASAGYTVATENSVASNVPLPDSYQITFAPFGGSNVIFNVLPVNSGNTFLIQGIADRVNGVCQKF